MIRDLASEIAVFLADRGEVPPGWMARFLPKIVIRDGGCWEWTGYRSQKGYGQFRLNGKIGGAHRVAYELLAGPVPEGLEIDHLCRNRACVNPEHLEPVTHRENVRRGEVRLIFGARTHCVNGHEFTPDNTYERSDGGGRGCRLCTRARLAAYRDRHRARIRERDRINKRRARDRLGAPERWPGRVHPAFSEKQP